jgi:hypothetical protein
MAALFHGILSARGELKELDQKRQYAFLEKTVQYKRTHL